MCEIDNTLTLCTCADELDKSQPHWILSRLKPLQMQIEGSIEMIDGFQEKDKDVEDSLCAELNSRNCFDFDYKAFNGDELFFNTGSKTLVLEFKSGAWSSQLSSGYSDHYTKANGYIHNIYDEEHFQQLST